MNNHITVIDVNYGVPGKYAVRVGSEVSVKLRLANCYHTPTGAFVKVANGDLAPNQWYTSYSNIDDAVATAKTLKASYPGYSVRIDCTIG